MNTDTYDAALAAAIDPWLSHMQWRRDFASWRERRLFQENYQAARLVQVQAAAGRLDGLQLLDLGAGMGGFAVAAARAGARVIAAEYNRAYCSIIALRAARYGLTLPILNTAGEALPLPAASVDLITAWDVLEHVQDPRAMLAEFARVLKPGGTALITAINRWAFVDPHYHMRGINYLPRPLAETLIERRGRTKRGAAFRDMQRLSDMHYFDYNDLLQLCHGLGFGVRDLRETALAAGELSSGRPSRRLLRGALRTIGLERAAYRFERRWLTGMFELELRLTGRPA
jgi:ubiquinone/menaquinone biosynthesis C-methylase UbiE